MAALFVGTLISTQAQTILVEEEFSSTEWENELIRWNPTYTTPTTMGGSGAFNGLNSVDLYFNKYRVVGAIEVLETGLCEAGLIHANPTTQTAVAFRFSNPSATAPEGIFELPELPTAGTITIHVKNGNPANDCNLGLEKYNASEDIWERIHLFLLRKRNDLKNTNEELLLDEVLTFDSINSNVPVKLRLINKKYDDGLTTRFLNMYHISVTAFEASSVSELRLSGVKQIDRRIVVEEPMQIAVYNTMGQLIMEQSVTKELEIPARFGKGVFMLKTNKGNQKIILQ